MNAGEVDSNLSTDTICPGCVAVLEVPLLSPLTLQGHFVILPYWQAARLAVKESFGKLSLYCQLLYAVKGQMPQGDNATAATHHVGLVNLALGPL